MDVSALTAPILSVVILAAARRRWRFSLWSVAVGALMFIVSTPLLEEGTHSLVFAAVPSLRSNPTLHTFYEALTAGVLEELEWVRDFAVLRTSD